MTYARMIGLGTALPGRCYTQSETLDALRPYLNHNPRAVTIFANAGINSRYLVVGGEYYAQPRGTQERNEVYMREAVPLGEAAISRCLNSAGLSPAHMDDLIVVSCTGIDTPGLDLRLAGKMNMPPALHRACVLGMGCYGAFPGLLRAYEAAQARPGSRALLLTLEICSLHFQPGDDSLENIVSSALFADGAAAAVITSDGGAPGPRLVDAETYCDYQTFDHMAFHLTDNGFRMSLSAYVPKLLAAKVEDFAQTLLSRNGLRREDVGYWGIHPGSSKILDYVQQRIGISDEQMQPSRKVLAEFGNMSSATILFILDRIQREKQPATGEYGVFMAFGPGLTMEAALMQW